MTPSSRPSGSKSKTCPQAGTVCVVGPDPDAHNSILGCIEHLLARVTALNGETDDVATNIPTHLDLEDVDRRLTDVLVRVRILRNATVPAGRLPTEVLGNIFKMAQNPFFESHPFTGSAGLPAKSAHTWMAVRLVCRYWHDVARSCPYLWTGIVLDGAESHAKQNRRLNLSRLYLSNMNRSRLDIFVRDPKSFVHTDFLAEMLVQLPYIRELRLLVSRSPLARYIEEVLQDSPAPTLETLVLTHIPPGDDHFSMASHLPKLFRGEFPALRSLAIQLFTQYASNNFRNLKQLHLVKQVYQGRCDLKALMDLLDASPALEDLMFSDISRLGDIGSGSEMLYDRCSHLPNLKRLAFINLSNLHCLGSRSLNVILSCLHLPPGLSLTVTRKGRYVDRTYGHEYLDCLPRSITKDLFKASDSIRKLRLSFTRREYTTTNTSSREYYSVFAAANSSALRVEGLWLEDRRKYERFFSDVAAISNTVEEMWVDGSDHWGRYDGRYSGLLRSSPFVAKFYLNWDDNWTAFSWLVALKTSDPVSGAMPCPALRELHIRGSAQLSIRSDDLENLEQTLSVRKAQGFPLEVVYIYLPLDEGHQSKFARCAVALAPKLQPLVGKIEMIRTENPPSMEPPPVAASRSTGRWDWPTWADPSPA